MDCCTQRGLNRIFTPGTAQREIRRFRKKGLEGGDKLLAQAIARQGVQGAHVLEVGGGIGGIQIELLRAGAAHAVDVDISQAYVAGARELAQSLGLGGITEHRVLDFAQAADQVEPADVVVLNHVVCCYPDMPALVRPAAGHARKLLALTFPREVWWMHAGRRVMNFAMWLLRWEFRFFIHPHRAIIQLVGERGLRPISDRLNGGWRIIIFER